MSGGPGNSNTSGGASGWSLLFAPDAPLQPVTCGDCGNVFAAGAASCPWCGRPTAAAKRAQADAEAVAVAPRGRPDVAAVTVVPPADADDRPEPIDLVLVQQVHHARRWAGVIVAAGVLLAIATGATVRARQDNGGVAAPATTTATTAAAATTSAAPVTTTPAPATTAPATTAATTVAPATSAATTSPATTTPATTTPAPATTAPATTTPATTAPATSTTVAGPTFSAVERRAIDIATNLSDAIVAHDWNTVRALSPNNATTDDVYNTFWGTIRGASLVPVTVTANAGDTYDVIAGVVSVDEKPTGITSTLRCARYNVSSSRGIVTSIKTVDVRSAPGTVTGTDPGVATELRTACASASF